VTRRAALSIDEENEMRFAPGLTVHHRQVGAVQASDERLQRLAAQRHSKSSPAPQPVAPAAHAGATLWAEIERLSVEMALREPALRTFFQATGPFDATPSRIVGTVLSRRLAANDSIQHDTLRAVLVETLDDEPAVLEFLEADLRAVASHDPACRSCLHALLNFKGFQALQTHRIAHSLWRRERFDLALWLSGQTSLALGVDIHPAAPIGKGVVLDHATGVVIGETAVVEDDVTILHGVTLGGTGKQRGDRHPKVRFGALLGAGATVLGNIEIGRMSRIGAGSVVLRSVPAYCTVAGVAARAVGKAPTDALQRIAARGARS
jgi:serine O-acetyltransferase